VGVTLRLAPPPVERAHVRDTGRGGVTRGFHTLPHAPPSADACGTGAGRSTGRRGPHAQAPHANARSAERRRLWNGRTRAAGRRAQAPHVEEDEGRPCAIMGGDEGPVAAVCSQR